MKKKAAGSYQEYEKRRTETHQLARKTKRLQKDKNFRGNKRKRSIGKQRIVMTELKY